jgi:hypothetical protein
MSHNSLMRLVLFAIMSFYAVGSAGAQTSINSLLTPFLARYELPASRCGGKKAETLSLWVISETRV